MKITSRSSTAKPYHHPAVASDPSHPLQRRHPRWSACLALEHWCRGLPPQAQHGPGRAPRKLSCSQKEEREVPTHPASQAVAQQSHATTQLWLPTHRYPSSAVTHGGRPTCILVKRSWYAISNSKCLAKTRNAVVRKIQMPMSPFDEPGLRLSAWGEAVRGRRPPTCHS